MYVCMYACMINVPLYVKDKLFITKNNSNGYTFYINNPSKFASVLSRVKGSINYPILDKFKHPAVQNLNRILQAMSRDQL